MFSWMATIIFTLGALLVGGFCVGMFLDGDNGQMPIGLGLAMLSAPFALVMLICAIIGWVSVLT